MRMQQQRSVERGELRLIMARRQPGMVEAELEGNESGGDALRGQWLKALL